MRVCSGHAHYVTWVRVPKGGRATSASPQIVSISLTLAHCVAVSNLETRADRNQKNAYVDIAHPLPSTHDHFAQLAEPGRTHRLTVWMGRWSTGRATGPSP